MVLPALDEGGYAWKAQVSLGQRLGIGAHNVDAIAEKDGRKILISMKWQQVSGTAEQKVPFEVICLVEAMEAGKYDKAYLVLGGEGWKWRTFYTGGGLKRYIPSSENLDTVAGRVARIQDEVDDAYLHRLCDWIGNHFGGYSIYHVDGRFLAGKMLSRDEAAERERGGQRYLIDETTAVTRFIFPCETNEEAEQVRFFFNELFVRTIIQLINAEDQIWMVESGMQNRVHIWRVHGEDDDGSYTDCALYLRRFDLIAVTGTCAALATSAGSWRPSR